MGYDMEETKESFKKLPPVKLPFISEYTENVKLTEIGIECNSCHTQIHSNNPDSIIRGQINEPIRGCVELHVFGWCENCNIICQLKMRWYYKTGRGMVYNFERKRWFNVYKIPDGIIGKLFYYISVLFKKLFLK